MPVEALSDTDRSLLPVRWWLYGVALLVAVVVLVGGATRLTDSGLSITEWAPIRGAIPPLTEADWNIAFTRYRETTEFQTVNSAMQLDQFKTIFWWEWGHRFLGRLVGLAYGLPLLIFWVRGMLPARLKMPLLVLLALGALQGFIGWWMVKSGLSDRVDVSQIRLAVHLTLACLILAFVLWLARSIVTHAGSAISPTRWQGAALTCLILLQIFTGGLVAGLDAGMAFNTWPTMNGEWWPSGLLATTSLLANFTDNAVMVQFNHRNLAYLIWACVLLHFFWLARACPGSTHYRRSALFLVLVTIQAIAGIATLLMKVPIGAALLHQFGALVVLGFAVAHWHAMSPTLSDKEQQADKSAKDVSIQYAHGNG